MQNPEDVEENLCNFTCGLSSHGASGPGLEVVLGKLKSRQIRMSASAMKKKQGKRTKSEVGKGAF